MWISVAVDCPGAGKNPIRVTPIYRREFQYVRCTANKSHADKISKVAVYGQWPVRNDGELVGSAREVRRRDITIYNRVNTFGGGGGETRPVRLILQCNGVRVRRSRVCERFVTGYRIRWVTVSVVFVPRAPMTYNPTFFRPGTGRL
jgi:hypothetical protein